MRADMISSGFGIGLFVLVSIIALDGCFHLDRGSIGVPFRLIIIVFFGRLIQFFSQSQIFLIQFLKLLLEGLQVGMVNFILECGHLPVQLYPFQLGLMDLFHNILVGLLPGALLFGGVEFVATHGEIVVAGVSGPFADPAEVEQEVQLLPGAVYQ